MIRASCALALLLVLPSCVAAIGNTGYGPGAYPKSNAPLLQEKVEAARRIVELRQAKVDDLRTQFEAGRTDSVTLREAEIAVEEARIQLLEFRADLAALQSKGKDED